MKSRVQLIIQILNSYFPHPEPALNFKDIYTLLIAVVLSAHSTDRVVNRVTPLLFAKASTPAEMIQLKVDEILAIIRPCGLGPKKAQAIWGLSERLLSQFNGKVPKTLEELESLPGVGHKTASVVLAQGFDLPAFPVDTHIQRCARRWGLTKKKSVAGVEKDLKALFEKDQWGRIHLQIILFARVYCPARGHKVDECPICKRLLP